MESCAASLVRYKYHHPRGEIKTISLAIGNRHDRHIPCNPSYGGHVPGYQTNDDVSNTRGEHVRLLAARQPAPVAHGEPGFYPGSTRLRTRLVAKTDHIPQTVSATRRRILSCCRTIRGLFEHVVKCQKGGVCGWILPNYGTIWNATGLPFDPVPLSC